ncbi:hypothetical protein [Streptomyces rubradiris]|uniref:Uncharacterized protein n=1 Tax=Streptomyces rubradiris TaxID=285531 RepID=A0ABQ3R529_STRRR|nr:hypothetical protein GCM10018792_67370 [Streptomyces rubradiris]GHI50965.1 hypothetical protein Srubr_08110 [Streptomyces rubradiris]
MRPVAHTAGQQRLTHTACLRRLVPNEFTARREVARAEPRPVFRQWACGPRLPPGHAQS